MLYIGYDTPVGEHALGIYELGTFARVRRRGENIYSHISVLFKKYGKYEEKKNSCLFLVEK